jgi:hypothetical protein
MTNWMNRYPVFAHAALVALIAACVLLMSAAGLFSQAEPAPPPQRTSFQFDFGPGKAPEGYVKVPADCFYSDQTGYGFDFGSKPTGVERGGSDPLRDGFVTATDYPILFSVKVPEGNYRITVTFGDAQGESRNTVRTEAGHLMAANIVTAAGKFETRSFIANVRRPTLPTPPVNAPGGSMVHMFIAGEDQAICWDDKLTIEFNGSRPAVAAMEIARRTTCPPFSQPAIPPSPIRGAAPAATGPPRCASSSSPRSPSATVRKAAKPPRVLSPAFAWIRS